jgi:hypothetical protein
VTYKPAIALACLAVAAFQHSASALELVAYSGAPTQQAIIAYFAPQLRDPASANWLFLPGPRSAIAALGDVANSDGAWACGAVNAKNGYGGYSGLVPFIARFADLSGRAVIDGAIANPEIAN